MSEVKIKMIRDYPIKIKSPFKLAGFDISKSKDGNFYVSVEPKKEKPLKKNLVNFHEINETEALEILKSSLQEKLGVALSGVNVFEYIFKNIKTKGKSKKYDMLFKMDFEDCRNYNGYVSAQSVWHGLGELLDKDIIARSKTPGSYFLNPNYFLPTNTISVTECYKLV
jgi:hypothetical protein